MPKLQLTVIDIKPGAATESQSGLQLLRLRIDGARMAPAGSKQAAAIVMHPTSNFMGHDGVQYLRAQGYEKVVRIGHSGARRVPRFTRRRRSTSRSNTGSTATRPACPRRSCRRQSLPRRGVRGGGHELAGRPDLFRQVADGRADWILSI